METIRRARPADLPLLHEIFHEQETAGGGDLPPRGPLPAVYRHELETGVVYVAEREGRVVGFAASISRGGVDFLTEFFVRLGFQGDGIGRRLLRHVVPESGRACFTSSSSDPRALALYIRAGLRPLFPCFYLRADGPIGLPSTGGLEVVDADPGDAALTDWDAEIGGRPRPADHAYWVRDTGAVPLWFRRTGETVGYGYVRLRDLEYVWHPAAVTVGPVGARTPDDAVQCVAAAVGWAAGRGPSIRVFVPGSHPALRMLLEGGFRITEHPDTFAGTEPTAFADPRRYLPSGGTLF